MDNRSLIHGLIMIPAATSYDDRFTFEKIQSYRRVGEHQSNLPRCIRPRAQNQVTGLCIKWIISDIRLAVGHVNAPWCPNNMAVSYYSQRNMWSAYDVDVVNPMKKRKMTFFSFTPISNIMSMCKNNARP